jgi:hypothetical protein
LTTSHPKKRKKLLNRGFCQWVLPETKALDIWAATHTGDMPRDQTKQYILAVVIASAFEILTKENMMEGLSAPLHPGALKYFKEVGLK